MIPQANARTGRIFACRRLSVARASGRLWRWFVPVAAALAVPMAQAQLATTTVLTLSNTTPNYVTPPAGGAGTTLNPVTLTATVTVKGTAAPVSGGIVTFYDNPGVPGAAAPDVIGSAPVQFLTISGGIPNGAVPGTATLQFAFGPGPHSLTATYSAIAFGSPASYAFASSTTASALSLTSNGSAAEAYGFQILGNAGTEASYDPQSSLTATYYNTNQDPQQGIPFIWGYGMQVPMGTSTITDQTSGMVYPMPGNDLAGTNDVSFTPQLTVIDHVGVLEGNYIYSLPNDGVTHFFVADIFQSGVPALVTLSATQNQIWTNNLYSNPNNYSGCNGGSTTAGSPTCAVTTPPVQGLAADVSGDNKLDLIIAHNDPTGKGSVGVLINSLNTAACSAGHSIACGAFNLPEVTYATGHPTGYVAVGDVNGDGYPDIVAVSSDGSNKIFVLLNNGNGTFTLTANTFSTGNGPTQLALGDFNHDGILDIAVLNTADASIGILTGKGDGTFHTMLPYPVGTNPTAFSMADLNLDGFLDFAITNNDSPTQAEVSFLYGQTGGTFNYVSNLAANQLDLAPFNFPETNPEPVAIQATDLNGDGYPDLFIGFNINQFSYAIYNPTTQQYAYTESPFADQANGINLRTVSAAVADLDGDGVKDWLLMPTINDEIACAGCSPSENNLMVRLNGSFVYGWTGPDAIDSPLGNHTFTSNYTPPSNSIYTAATAGPIVLDILAEPEPTLTPSTLDFGNVLVGTAAAPRTLTLQNTGSGPLTNIAFSISAQSPAAPGGFGQTNNCPATLPAGSSCTIQVTFTPTSPVGHSANVSLSHGAGRAKYVPLFGGGASFQPVNINETITLTDAVASPAFATPVPINEPITLTDAVAPPAFAAAIPINEPITLTDAVTPPAFGTPVPISENITLTDTVTPPAFATPVPISENITLHDAVATPAFGTPIPISENITLTDAVSTPAFATPVPISENITLTDTVATPAFATPIPIHENILLTDNVSVPAVTVSGDKVQYILFIVLPFVPQAESSLTLTAHSTSGLPISYTVTGPASLLGSTLTLTGPGLVKVTASQGGNSTFAPATPVSQSFTVTP